MLIKMVNGRFAKIICIIIGVIFVITAIYGVVKDANAKKSVATVISIIDYYTNSKDVRTGNDGGRDSYKEYCMVAEVRISENDENQRISITRRKEEKLPKIGDEIYVIKSNNGKWSEYKPKLFSMGTVVLLVVGVLLLLIGVFGKVR